MKEKEIYDRKSKQDKSKEMQINESQVLAKLNALNFCKNLNIIENHIFVNEKETFNKVNSCISELKQLREKEQKALTEKTFTQYNNKDKFDKSFPIKKNSLIYIKESDFKKIFNSHSKDISLISDKTVISVNTDNTSNTTTSVGTGVSSNVASRKDQTNIDKSLQQHMININLNLSNNYENQNMIKNLANNKEQKETKEVKEKDGKINKDNKDVKDSKENTNKKKKSEIPLYESTDINKESNNSGISQEKKPIKLQKNINKINQNNESNINIVNYSNTKNKIVLNNLTNNSGSSINNSSRKVSKVSLNPSINSGQKSQEKSLSKGEISNSSFNKVDKVEEKKPSIKSLISPKFVNPNEILVKKGKNLSSISSFPLKTEEKNIKRTLNTVSSNKTKLNNSGEEEKKIDVTKKKLIQIDPKKVAKKNNK